MRMHLVTDRQLSEAFKRGTGTSQNPSNPLDTGPIAMRQAEIRRQLREALKFLADLTRVDGAVCLTDELAPLSFGSILRAPAWTGRTLLGPNVDTQDMDQIDTGRFGTRHNSAIALVGANPGTVAFVVSQDGPVRGMTARNGVVYLWPDCLASVFAE